MFVTLQIINLTQLVETCHNYQTTLMQQQSNVKHEIEFLESQNLYYDPPIYIQPEYFTVNSTIPGNFPSSAYSNKLSFNIERNMQLQFQNVQSFIQSLEFDNFILEGQIPVNITNFTSAATMQLISRDIVIINLEIGEQYQHELIKQIATMFDRIWLWDGQRFNQYMLIDVINFKIFSQPQKDFNIQDLTRIYQYINNVSESQYILYRNQVFISFFILFHNRDQIKGKNFPDYNLFYWCVNSISISDRRFFSGLYTYFCQITSNFRNTCISQAIKILLEQNYDTSIMISIQGQQIIVGRAVYDEFRYIGISFNIASTEDFNLNCLSDDQTGLVLSLNFQQINYIIISQDNQYRDPNIANNAQLQLIPFPTKRFKEANLFLEYIEDQIQIPLNITHNVGFISKNSGYFVYQNVTDGFSVQVQLGQQKSLFRNRCSPVKSNDSNFVENFLQTEIPQIIQKEIIPPTKIFPNSSLLEEDIDFEMINVIQLQTQGYLNNFQYYYPIINDSLQLLTEFGDITYFKKDILDAMSSIFELDIAQAKQILNKYVKINYLDKNKKYMEENQYFCQKMNTVDYFIRKFPKEDTDYPNKLILDYDTYLDLRVSSFKPNQHIFSPIIADIILQSINQIVYQLKAFLYLQEKSNQNKQDIFVYVNKVMQIDYFKRLHLDSSVLDPYYKIQVMKQIYNGINVNAFAYFNQEFVDNKIVIQNLKKIVGQQTDLGYIYTNYSYCLFVTQINSYSLDITNTPVPVAFIATIQNIRNIDFFKSLPQTYYIYDQFGNPVHIHSQLYSDVIIQTLLDIDYLQIQTANQSIRVQLGQLNINRNFNFQYNKFISTKIEFIDEQVKCFGTFTTRETIDSEIFTCQFNNFFIVAFTHINILDQKFKLQEIISYNYGQYENVTDYLLSIESTPYIYYNFTQRSNNSRVLMRFVANDTAPLQFGLESVEIISLIITGILLLIFALMLLYNDNVTVDLAQLQNTNKSRIIITDEMKAKALKDLEIISRKKATQIKVTPIVVNQKFNITKFPSELLLYKQDFQAVVLNNLAHKKLNGKNLNPMLLSILSTQRPDPQQPTILELSTRKNIFLGGKLKMANGEITLGKNRMHIMMSFSQEIPDCECLVDSYKLNDFQDLYNRNLGAAVPRPLDIVEEEVYTEEQVLFMCCQ